MLSKQLLQHLFLHSYRITTIRRLHRISEIRTIFPTILGRRSHLHMIPAGTTTTESGSVPIRVISTRMLLETAIPTLRRTAPPESDVVCNACPANRHLQPCGSKISRHRRWTWPLIIIHNSVGCLLAILTTETWTMGKYSREVLQFVDNAFAIRFRSRDSGTTCPVQFSSNLRHLTTTIRIHTR